LSSISRKAVINRSRSSDGTSARPGQPVGREHAARHAQRQPVGQAGDNLDAIAPIRRLDGRAHHLGDLGRLEGFAEAREDVGADRLQDLGVGQRRRENDDPDVGPDGTDFVHEGQVVVGRCGRIGNQDVDRMAAGVTDGIQRVATDGHLVPRELAGVAQRVHERPFTADDKNVSHPLLA
jgi:hypothetical protein